MRRPGWIVAAATLALAPACSPSDLEHLVREPTLGHLAWYLLLAPILFVAKLLLEQLVGEALGMLIARLLPPWMKTRRALWTGVALMCVATFGAVAYWSRH